MKKVSIACIAYENGKIFIARRNPTGQMGDRWEFPGGKVEAGESDQDSIVRELQEEFGITVSVGEKIGETNFKHCGDDFSLHAYFVKFPHDGINERFTLTEHSDYKWVELAEIPELNFVDSDLLIYPQVCKFIAGTL